MQEAEEAPLALQEMGPLLAGLAPLQEAALQEAEEAPLALQEVGPLPARKALAQGAPLARPPPLWSVFCDQLCAVTGQAPRHHHCREAKGAAS